MSLLSLLKLRARARMGRGVVVTGPIWLRGGGELIIGDDVVLDASRVPIEFNVERGARLQIGHGTRIGGGTSIEAIASVVIGSNCELKEFVKILDSNHHMLRGNRLERPAGVPVVVDDEAVLGTRSILLPGAEVGRGAHLMAGSVLTRRLPPGVTASGVPASTRGAPSMPPPEGKPRP